MRDPAADEGSAVLESIFGIILVMTLVLGVIQVGLALYARNVVAAATHEGARAAIELGARDGDAVAITRRTIHDAAGGVTRDLSVDATQERSGDEVAVHVRVEAMLEPFGPIPISIPVVATATASRARPR
ncbi:MAG: TadE/TadG family type IV pilus assembly protein [Actinomycetota bacterium]